MTTRQYTIEIGRQADTLQSGSQAIGAIVVEAQYSIPGYQDNSRLSHFENNAVLQDQYPQTD